MSLVTVITLRLLLLVQKRNFDLKEILASQEGDKKKKKRRKGKGKEEDDEGEEGERQDDFKIDTTDPRYDVPVSINWNCIQKQQHLRVW